MQKKLTLTIDKDVYEGLHKTIGRRKISKYIEDMVRPHVMQPALEAEYAEMAKDDKQEKEAVEWTENTFRDAFDETR
jgi:predicted CopG family antitoxin